MDIKLQKRKHSSLRKLTKVDENNNIIEGQTDLYVRVEDVPSNLVNSDATPLSDEVFNKINWKDNKALLFTQADTLPEPISGITQIVSLKSGEIWCVPGSNVVAFKLGADDLALYLKKNFEAYEPVIILGSNTKIGALPTDYVTNGNAGESTYLEFSDGNISFKLNGTQKHLMSDKKVSFTQGNGEICIDDTEVALKHHSDKTTIGLINGSFYIKGNNTQISEDLTNNKLNFFTNLANAVYGNKAIYLEFYSDQVRFLDAINQKEMLNVKQNGSVYAYGPIYANGSNRVVDTSTINNYIQSYFDEHFDAKFDSKFMESYANAIENKITLFEGASNAVSFTISDISSFYQIDFSDTNDGVIMTICFRGTDINNLPQKHKVETNGYYLVKQYYASDESEDDTIKVSKIDSLGSNRGFVWIRGLYKL